MALGHDRVEQHPVPAPRIVLVREEIEAEDHAHGGDRQEAARETEADGGERPADDI